MIKNFRELHSPQADTIEAEFCDLVLGYDHVLIEAGQATQMFGNDRQWR